MKKYVPKVTFGQKNNRLFISIAAFDLENRQPGKIIPIYSGPIKAKEEHRAIINKLRNEHQTTRIVKRAQGSYSFFIKKKIFVNLRRFASWTDGLEKKIGNTKKVLP